MYSKSHVYAAVAALALSYAIFPSNALPSVFIGLSSTGLLHKAEKEKQEIQNRADRQLAYFNNLHNCVHKP